MGSGICSSFHTVKHPSKLCSKQLHQRKILFKQAKYWEGRSHRWVKALYATLTAKARHAEWRSHTARAAWCWTAIKTFNCCLCPWQSRGSGAKGRAVWGWPEELTPEAPQGASLKGLRRCRPSLAERLLLPCSGWGPDAHPAPAAGSTPRKPAQHSLLWICFMLGPRRLAVGPWESLHCGRLWDWSKGDASGVRASLLGWSHCPAQL